MSPRDADRSASRRAARASLIVIVPLMIMFSGSLAGPHGRSVRVAPVTLEEVRRLRGMGLDLESWRGSRARFYASPDQEELLFHLGYLPLPEVRLEPLVPYPTLTDVYDSMDSVLTAHPDICHGVVLGTSVEGRPIRAVVVSDHPGVEEVEPELRITGAIHGDEPASTTVTIYFLKSLTDNYGTSPMCTHLVDAAETWVVPVVNPDGYYADERYNANLVDLNRNLSYMWESSSYSGPYPFSEPETRAVRDLTMLSWPDIENFENPFSTGLSLHGGEACFNYVWNYSSDPVPDTLEIVDMAADYASLCTVPGFWVTEGWAWYVVNGDVNDWSYGECGTIDHTIEVHQDKHVSDWPAVNAAHYMAILDFFTSSTHGLWGTVTTVGGDPLDALISIGFSGDDPGDSEPLRFCRTDVLEGDYHRCVIPGTYDVTASVEGYAPKTVYGVAVGEGEDVEVSFVFGTGISGAGACGPNPAIAVAANPATSVCRLRYDTGGAPADIRIYDALGRLVLTAGVQAGIGEYAWDRGQAGRAGVPDGVYYARLETAGGCATTSLVLVH
ncbi:hypothetical protein JW921_10255 [Candidatus Fermentibacterales bacterium]|nr:hypothetical protein [Candidatus Fermentibacterales bacterium]